MADYFETWTPLQGKRGRGKPRNRFIADLLKDVKLGSYKKRKYRKIITMVKDLSQD